MSRLSGRDRLSDVKTAVIGLGTMGAGIVEVFAKAGHEVVAIDGDQAGLDRGREILTRSTDRAVAKAKISEAERDELLPRVRFQLGMDGLGDASFVVEAVSENPELKARIFADLDEAVGDTAILATNTSSLSITALAAGTKNPGRVLGLHFFNPAPVQPLVEVISTLSTEMAAVERTIEIVAALGKSPVRCGDRAGFIVNALLVPYLNRAAALYQDGLATREEIDAAMEAVDYPMGPLKLLDLVGLDVSVAVLDRLYDESKNRLHAAAPLLRQLVAAGWLGKKSGRGLYSYESGQATQEPGPGPAIRRNRADELPAALLIGYLNDCLNMVGVGYATADDIDTAMSLGCAMPKPFDVLTDVGPRQTLVAQQALFAETGEPGHRPSLLLEELAVAEDPAAALEALRQAR